MKEGSVAAKVVRRVFFVGFMFLLLLGTPSIAPAESAKVNCGDTLGPGGKFKLKADLICVEGDVLTLRDRVQLDLNGHTIVTVVVLTGRRAELTNGTIEGRGLCISLVCLILEGRGEHVVENVTVFETSLGQGGISVRSNNNRLIGNRSFGDVGFEVGGSNNYLFGNIAAIGQAGFHVGGNGNKLIGNSSSQQRENFHIVGNNNVLTQNFSAAGNQPGEGFIVDGRNNRLFRNVAMSTGIQLFGQNNVVKENVALLGSTDLFDADPTCDNNTWKDNIFATSQAGNIDNPTCID